MSQNEIETHEEADGTKIEFVHRQNNSQIVVIWLSAFTKGPILGRVTKVTPKFHGFKISKSFSDLDWLLIRDSYGLTGDGTYYGGSAGRLFVEDSVKNLILNKKAEYLARNSDTTFVLMGSSMGGYAAIKMAILTSISKVFVYSPHLDMDIAMSHCGRGPWIKYCLSDDTEANQRYLRRLQFLVESTKNLPRLVIQVSQDDPYVYPEQVVPFVQMYKELGGDVEIDLRESGGHGSSNAPDQYIKTVVKCLGRDQEIDFETLKLLPSREFTRSEKLEKNLQKFENAFFKFLQLCHIKK